VELAQHAAAIAFHYDTAQPGLDCVFLLRGIKVPDDVEGLFLLSGTSLAAAGVEAALTWL
jgi:hypothetical protein